MSDFHSGINIYMKKLHRGYIPVGVVTGLLGVFLADIFFQGLIQNVVIFFSLSLIAITLVVSIGYSPSSIAKPASMARDRLQRWLKVFIPRQ